MLAQQAAAHKVWRYSSRFINQKTKIEDDEEQEGEEEKRKRSLGEDEADKNKDVVMV